MTDVTAEKIRVSGFEILKQNNSSAIENITILFRDVSEHKSALKNFDISRKTYAHINSAHGRPKIIAIGSRPNNR